VFFSKLQIFAKAAFYSSLESNSNLGIYQRVEKDRKNAKTHNKLMGLPR